MLNLHRQAMVKGMEVQQRIKNIRSNQQSSTVGPKNAERPPFQVVSPILSMEARGNQSLVLNSYRVTILARVSG